MHISLYLFKKLYLESTMLFCVFSSFRVRIVYCKFLSGYFFMRFEKILKIEIVFMINFCLLTDFKICAFGLPV